MIEIAIAETGDTAEADTPEEAMYAARTIGREATKGRPAGWDPVITFTVAGVVVGSATLRGLNR